MEVDNGKATPIAKRMLILLFYSEWNEEAKKNMRFQFSLYLKGFFFVLIEKYNNNNQSE